MTVAATWKEEALVFVEALHRDVDGHVCWFTKPGGSTFAAPRTIPSVRVDGHVWVSVCTFPERERSKLTARCIPGLWADNDPPEHLVPKDAPPSDVEGWQAWREETRIRLLEMTPLPTMLVDSGSGWQTFWLFDEPLRLEPAATRQRAEIEAMLRAVANTVCGDSSVAELARIMRVPGTMNVKPGRGACRLVMDSGPRYPPADLGRAFDPDMTWRRALRTGGGKGAQLPLGELVTSGSQEALELLRQADIELREIRAEDHARNKVLTSIAGRLHGQFFEPERMRWLLHLANETLCKPPLTRGEVDTIARSIAKYPAGPSADFALDADAAEALAAELAAAVTAPTALAEVETGEEIDVRAAEARARAATDAARAAGDAARAAEAEAKLLRTVAANAKTKAPIAEILVTLNAALSRGRPISLLRVVHRDDSYDLVFKDDRVVTVRSLLRFVDVSEAIANSCGVALHPGLKKSWTAIAQMMLDISEEGAALTEEEETRLWIEEGINQRKPPVIDPENERVKLDPFLGTPFFYLTDPDDGHLSLHLFLRPFQSLLAMHGTRLSQKDLARRIAVVGWSKARITVSKKQVKCWAEPAVVTA